MSATSYISLQNPNLSQLKSSIAIKHSNSNPLCSKTRRFSIRSTAETSITDGGGNSEQSSIETPKIPPSLISALNVEKALRGTAITDADHYGRLGIQKGCPYDQVPVAYRKKIEQVKSEGLEEEELNEKLELLKESYAILSTVEERRLYDWSLARNERPDRYKWPFEVDITQVSNIPGPPEEPEDVGPTRLVGYFFLAWIILGCVLSVALNR